MNVAACSSRAGFTLLETTIALGLAVVVASCGFAILRGATASAAHQETLQSYSSPQT